MKLIRSRILKTELIEWRTLKWFTTDLKKLPKLSLERLKQSIRNNNFIQPFNVWQTAESTMILDGHYRRRAMELLEQDGYDIPDKLPANFIECADRHEAAKLVLLYSSIYATITNEGLEELLREYPMDLSALDLEIDLANFRFDTFLENTLGIVAPEETNQDDIPEIPATPRTNKGDLYELGTHRLLCGSATDMSHATRLMGQQKAALVFTDPPYGVSYSAPCGKFEIIKGDEKTGDDLVATLLVPSLKVAASIAQPNAAFYIWHASSTREDFSFTMKAAGLVERQYLIWAKPGFIMGRSDYRWAHEPCFYAGKEGHTPVFYGDRSQSTVWRATIRQSGHVSVMLGSGVLLMDGSGGQIYIQPKAPKGKKIRTLRIVPGHEIDISTTDKADDLWEVGRDYVGDHPTQKPVALATRGIENSSLPGDIVYDGFLGSGTTLIAAELSDRSCYGTELTPGYCDVIVSRYVKLTGKKTIIRNGNEEKWEE